MGTVITVGGIRGGVGKSSTAVAMALMAAAEGHSVFLADFDKDGSALHWARDRIELGRQPVIPCERLVGEEGLRRIDEEISAAYDYTIIDMFGARGDNPILVGALTLSDFGILPSRAAKLSLRVFDKLDENVGLAKKYNPDLKVYLIATHTITNPKVDDVSGFKEFVEDTLKHIDWSGIDLKMRHSYSWAFDEGTHLVESDSKSKGAAEVRSIWTLIDHG